MQFFLTAWAGCAQACSSAGADFFEASGIGNGVNEMIYWPAFDFEYVLDISRLLPHIAAIEASRTAASLRIRPPQWQELPAPDATEPDLPQPQDQKALNAQIQARKDRVLTSNAGKDRAWVKERFVAGSAPLSLNDILHMHRLVADETGIRYDSAGKLRTEGFKVVVGTPDVGFHVGAPPGKVPGLMARYIRFINGDDLLTMPAAVQALVAHYFFTTIHPFDDGNGRVSRLVAAALLFQRGYNGHGCYALFSYFYQNEKQYHRLIFQTQQNPRTDLTAFVSFGLEGLVGELQGINTFIKVRLQRTVEREVLTPALRRRMEARKGQC